MSIAHAVPYARIVGQTLCWRRQLSGLDQAQLAQRVGVNQPTWSKIERGELAVSIEQLLNAADALGTTPSAILETADLAVTRFRAQGVSVTPTRSDPALSGAAAVLGVAAVALLIASIMKS